MKILRSKGKGFTLIELLVVIVVIAIFAALLRPVINWSHKKAVASRAKFESAQETSESKGQTITLEWKQGVRATPETIEIVEGVSEITVNNCNDIVLTLADGSHRTIPKENLAEYRER